MHKVTRIVSVTIVGILILGILFSIFMQLF
jgi:hypothetical protein